MDTLAEDRAEFDDEKGRQWVYRARREWGIGPTEKAVWLIQVEQDVIGGETVYEHDTKMMFVSPADAISTAEAMGSNGRRDGFGVWTLEVFGDGENSPTMLRVRPAWDEAN